MRIRSDIHVWCARDTHNTKYPLSSCIGGGRLPYLFLFRFQRHAVMRVTINSCVCMYVGTTTLFLFLLHKSENKREGEEGKCTIAVKVRDDV